MSCCCCLLQLNSREFWLEVFSLSFERFDETFWHLLSLKRTHNRKTKKKKNSEEVADAFHWSSLGILFRFGGTRDGWFSLSLRWSAGTSTFRSRPREEEAWHGARRDAGEGFLIRDSSLSLSLSLLAGRAVVAKQKKTIFLDLFCTPSLARSSLVDACRCSRGPLPDGRRQHGAFVFGECAVWRGWERAKEGRKKTRHRKTPPAKRGEQAADAAAACARWKTE